MQANQVNQANQPTKRETKKLKSQHSTRNLSQGPRNNSNSYVGKYDDENAEHFIILCT